MKRQTAFGLALPLLLFAGPNCPRLRRSPAEAATIGPGRGRSPWESSCSPGWRCRAGIVPGHF